MERMAVSVIGAGGMAGRHLRRLLELEKFEVKAVAEINDVRQDCRDGVALAASAGVKTFVDYREMLDAVPVEAVFIGTPHFLHQPMAEDAMARGLHVFCEKPPAPTVESCKKMLRARDRYGKALAIGFQHVGHTNAQWLKRFIAEGRLGAIREVVALLPNYRDNHYYERSPWVGKKKVDGHWCLDGVLSNQMVHFINQSMFFASTRPAPHVARPAPGSTVSALYHAHETPALEMDDIGMFRCRLEGSVNFYCIATTAVEGGGNITIELIGDKGRALYDDRVTVWLHGDEPFVHNEPDEPDYLYENFFQVVRAGATPLSPLDEAVKSVAVLESVFQAADYQVKKIRWDERGNLRELLYRGALYRSLFRDLPDAPAWSQA